MQRPQRKIFGLRKNGSTFPCSEPGLEALGTDWGLVKFSYIWASNFKPHALTLRRRKGVTLSLAYKQRLSRTRLHLPLLEGRIWENNVDFLSSALWIICVCSLSLWSLSVSVNGQFSHGPIFKGYKWEREKQASVQTSQLSRSRTHIFVQKHSMHLYMMVCCINGRFLNGFPSCGFTKCIMSHILCCL